jgi:thymidine phosphorylase
LLRGGGPADTRELTCALGGEMLLLGGVVPDAATGAARIAEVLGNGAALEVFRKVVVAQGGDPAVCDSPGRVLPKAKERAELVLPAGTITAIDSEKLGIAALLLGAGRRKKEDAIDPAAGLVVDAYVGEAIAEGAPPSVLFQHNLPAGDARVAEAVALAKAAFTVTPGAPPAPPRPTRILEVLR